MLSKLFSMPVVLGLAAAFALGCVGWLVVADQLPEGVTLVYRDASRTPPAPPTEEVTTFAPSSEVADVAPLAPEPVRLGHSSIAAKDEVPISQLIAKYRVTNGTEARLDLVQELVSRNSAEAINAIHFVFLGERHPKVKAGLLAGLGDMDADLVPQVRLQLLSIALHGEAREVRSTALDLLSESDSPAATDLIRQTMKSDPDREIRDAAREIYRNRTESGE